jgi:hypothetical protein
MKSIVASTLERDARYRRIGADSSETPRMALGSTLGELKKPN